MCSLSNILDLNCHRNLGKWALAKMYWFTFKRKLVTKLQLNFAAESQEFLLQVIMFLSDGNTSTKVKRYRTESCASASSHVSCINITMLKIKNLLVSYHQFLLCTGENQHTLPTVLVESADLVYITVKWHPAAAFSFKTELCFPCFHTTIRLRILSHGFERCYMVSFCRLVLKCHLHWFCCKLLWIDVTASVVV